MTAKFQQLRGEFFIRIEHIQQQLQKWWTANRWKIFLLAALLAIYNWKDVSFEVQTGDENRASSQSKSFVPTNDEGILETIAQLIKKMMPVERSVTETWLDEIDFESPISPKPTEEKFSLFSFADLTAKQRTPDELAAFEKQVGYVKRFATVAQAEMEKFNIPASIILAQGLIETSAGDSRLARNNNNHFGMKCFSRSCKKGHCSNFSDDSHKDFFRKYNSAWESFRAHSHLLKSPRYKALFELSPTDYKGWAHGLKKAGYATDKNYAEKLIAVIEDLHLYEFDR